MLKIISKELNIPEIMLRESINNSRKYVKHLRIPKRNGSFRNVYHPSRKLKVIQYWLNNRIFKNIKIHDCATAYKKNRSIKYNVKQHQRGRYFIKLDFKNFFPSIKFEDFAPIVKEWNRNTDKPFEEDKLLSIIRRSCFYHMNMLPIGYPTSPIISNTVMFEFDARIDTLISDEDKYGKCVYTRYADDLTFSTNLKGVCQKIEDLIKNELKNMTSPKLELNFSKTKYVSSSGGSAFITGLRVCYDGHITIHRKYKDRIRLLLSLYQKGMLSKEEDILSLRGHLSYIKSVDGSFYTKLQRKYFEEIDRVLIVQK